MCLVKWSWNTRMFGTLGGLFSYMVISMLVKSVCKRSTGVVDTVGCRGTLGKLSSCCKQCMKDCMDFCTWFIIPGHQKHSCNKDRVWSCPWWPASQWHPFRVTTQCALGTTKSRRSSVLPLGIEHRYKAPWWIAKFCWFCGISLSSSLEACSARSIFRFVCFCAFSQSKTVLNIRSSLRAFAQSVICISINRQPVATCVSCSKCWSPSTTAGSWTWAWCVIPKVTPLRMDFTVSRSSWVVAQLSTSATVLSCPFWYSNSKLNYARAPTHQWPICFDIMYMSGLLSVHTTND